MSGASFPAPTYNSLYFIDETASTITKQYLQENYLQRVGALTDIAVTTTFTGDISLQGTAGSQSITFPNESKQFTAMNTLPSSQTYTNSTITTDANGAIASITSGQVQNSAKIATAYGSTTNTYLDFNINTAGGTSGSWLQNQFFTIRYNISIDYNPSTTTPYQFQNNGTATGTMDIYPYRFGSNWCKGSNAPNITQLPNAINGNSNYNMVDTGTSPIGGQIAPNGREFWSYGGATVSGTNSFYLGGGINTLYFQLANPSGWSSGKSFTYSIEIELLSTGANASPITTSGFNTNF